METLTKKTLISELTNFVGTKYWYQHPQNNAMTFTDGVKYFAERAQSYWLLGVIVTEYFPMLKDHPLLVITAESQREHCVIFVTDGNENQLQSKHIPYTTLIEGQWKFYLMDNVLLLPSEY